jgi:hypothetical protein
MLPEDFGCVWGKKRGHSIHLKGNVQGETPALK